MESLQILQDYDIYGQHTHLITPALVLKLWEMIPNDATTWLNDNFSQAQIRQIHTKEPIRDNLASLLVHGFVTVKEDQRTYPFTALVDSGCTIAAIDRGYVKQHKIPVTPLKEPLISYLGDGSTPKSGLLTECINIQMRIGNHQESIQLIVMELAKMDVFLGYNWLSWHNPEINWEKNEIGFTRCLSKCGKSHVICTTGTSTVVWEEPQWFWAYVTKSTLLVQEASKDNKEKTF